MTGAEHVVRRKLALLLIFAACGIGALGQHQPYTVHDTRPVILQGPYLFAPSETSVSVMWMTDTPAHSKVLYGTGGALTSVAEPLRDGLRPVGTLHTITIRGLEPGRTYQYRAVSTRVVKVKAYWPEKGRDVESPVYSFTTLDRKKPRAAFSFITDTHEDPARIKALVNTIDWQGTDFLVHGGDAFNSVESEDQLFTRWLEPLGAALAHVKPLFYIRGNHEMRGSFARRLRDYLPVEEDRFYLARDHGPLHLIVLDTGEDKPDNTNVYGGLNNFAEYREEEFAWLKKHAATEPRMKEAPFRIILMHQPEWGWVNGENASWTELANEAGIDLIIGGHKHSYSRTPPSGAAKFTVVAVDQDQVTRVEATAGELKLVVTGVDGKVVDSLVLKQPFRNR
jgi:predicted phosphodiesterase